MNSKANLLELASKGQVKMLLNSVESDVIVNIEDQNDLKTPSICS